MKWEYVKLASLCKTGAGGTPLKSKKAYYENGDVPWLRSGEVKNKNITNSEIKITQEGLKNSSAKLFPPGTVLIAMYGATAGQVGILNFACSTNQAVCGILPNNKIVPKFLYYFFLGFKNDLVAQAVGNAQPNISQAKIKNTLIPVLTVEEQHQLVKILDQAFEKIERAYDNIDQNIKNTEQLLRSKCNEVFSQKVEGWVEKRLGDLGKVSMCKRILKKQTSTEGGIPFYKIGTFGKEPNAFIPEEVYNNYRSKYSFPKKGDILISASGTIGRRVIYDGKPAYFQDSNIVWIDNDESRVLNEFLYEFYGICNWNPSKGATISRLYNDDLRRIKISFPPIEHQKAIVPAIRELKKKTKNIADQYRVKQKNLEELKKSLLESAFKGELIKEEVTHEN